MGEEKLCGAWLHMRKVWSFLQFGLESQATQVQVPMQPSLSPLTWVSGSSSQRKEEDSFHHL